MIMLDEVRLRHARSLLARTTVLALFYLETHAAAGRPRRLGVAPGILQPHGDPLRGLGTTAAQGRPARRETTTAGDIHAPGHRPTRPRCCRPRLPAARPAAARREAGPGPTLRVALAGPGGPDWPDGRLPLPGLPGRTSTGGFGAGHPHPVLGMKPCPGRQRTSGAGSQGPHLRRRGQEEVKRPSERRCRLAERVQEAHPPAPQELEPHGWPSTGSLEHYPVRPTASAGRPHSSTHHTGRPGISATSGPGARYTPTPSASWSGTAHGGPSSSSGSAGPDGPSPWRPASLPTCTTTPPTGPSRTTACGPSSMLSQSYAHRYAT